MSQEDAADRAFVDYAVQDGIATITLRRPEKRNAMNAAMRQQIVAAFGQFERDPAALVAILTGEGDTFCAGADLTEMADTGFRTPSRETIPHLGRTFHVTKPTIAQVGGRAFAGGFLLAQMCDLCTASEDAAFGLTEVRWGRGAPWATPLIWMLPQRIMMELLITGEPLSARRAYDLGFVNRLCRAETLAEETRALAHTIARNAPLSVQAGRELCRAATEMGRAAALEAGDRLFEKAYLSDDALEGPRAFKEKRDPVWRGR